MVLFDKLVDVNISHLNVDQCNPVTKLKFWRLYVIQKVTDLFLWRKEFIKFLVAEYNEDKRNE